MTTIPEKAFPLCVCTILDDGMRRYTLQSAAPQAVDAWLVHLSAWHYEMQINNVQDTKMRILLDLRSTKSLPMARISRVLPNWRAKYPQHELRIAIIPPNHRMIGLAENLVEMMRISAEIQFFVPESIDQAHQWLRDF